MSSYRSLYIIFFVLLLAGGVNGQYKDSDFKKYTTADGLSDGYVLSIIQDSLGFMWIGTTEGLNKFDGNTFSRFFIGSPPGFLISSQIKKLKQVDGGIGAITSFSFHLLDPYHNRSRKFIIPDSTSFVAKRNAVFDAVKLQNGKYAVTTASGFYVFNEDGTLYFRHDAYHPEDAGKKRIFFGRQIVTVLYPDVLVYVESRGLMHYDARQNTFMNVDSLSAFGKIFSHPVTTTAIHWITKTQTDKSEFIFLSPTDSLIYYDFQNDIRISSPLPFHWEKSFTWKSEFFKLSPDTFALTGGVTGFYMVYLDKSKGIIRMDTQPILNCCTINSIYKGNDQRIWVGASNGLFQQIKSKPFVEKFSWPGDEKTLGFTDALLYKDKLYVSQISDQAGLLVVNHKTMQPEKAVNFYNIKEWNFIISIEMYHPDTLWLGTQRGVLWYAVESGDYAPVYNYDHNNIIVFADILEPEDKHGMAWMLHSLGGQILKYDVRLRRFQVLNNQSKPPIPFQQIKHIAYDSYGDVWIGGHGLSRWNSDANLTDTIFSSYGGPLLYNEDIITMSADSSGSLWFHNSENGVLQYKIKEKTFAHFGIYDGLPTDNYQAFSPVIDGIMFLQSRRHLTRFDTKTKRIEYFEKEETLPSSGIAMHRMYWEPEHRHMYAFYKNEILRFPLNRPEQNYSSGELLIQHILLDELDTIWWPTNKVIVKSNHQRVEINFTIIDFEEGKEYLFAYKLGNVDEWTNISNQRTIYLSNLTAGEQQLTIRSTGLSGEQKTASLTFVIKAPLWQRPWLASLFVILLGTCAFLLYNRRVKRIQEKAAVDTMLAEAEMKALHAQMNPHFIFNSLNSIREMIMNNETRDASRYLSDFAHLIRMTLEHSNHPYITLRSTIDYLRKYIEMEKIRTDNFNFRMECEGEIDPDDITLPPMLIQPFIENSIWHGANGHDKKCLEINVTFKRLEDQLVCIIEDDGVGIQTSLAKKKRNAAVVYESVGISNIEKRIGLLNKKYNLKSKITIADKSNTPKSGTGTIITITLPLDLDA